MFNQTVSMFLLLVACLPATGFGQEVTPIDLPPELERVLRDYERAWQAGSTDDLAELFVQDGFVRNDGRWVRGRDSIRAAYQDAKGPLRLRAYGYSVDGDVGYIIGGYGYGFEPDVTYSGEFLLALRRDRVGRWLIVADLDG